MSSPPSSVSAFLGTGSGRDVTVRRNFPFPDQETKIKLQEFSESVNIEMDQSDIEASATMLKDLNIKPEFYHAAVSRLFMDNIEHEDKSREMVARVIAQLMEEKLITKVDYLHALEELFKMADDLIIDLPQLYKHIATFYVLLLNKRFINLVDVHNAAQDILPQYGATMLKELLLQYEALYGKDPTVLLWYESCLNPIDFIKSGSPEQAEQYLTDAKLGYLFDSNSIALYMQTVGTRIKQYLKANAKFMDIYHWISCHVGLKREVSDEFIRALTKAVIEHCIDDKTKLNTQEFMKWYQMLQKYIECKAERELQALYAIQRLMVELDHPQNLLHSIVEHLYNNDVIMDGFHLWKDSTDPLEAAGKGVCLKEIAQLRFIPEDYIQCLAEFRPKFLFVVPSLMLFLATHPKVTQDHLSSVNSVLVGAAAASLQLQDKFKQKCGKDVDITQGYGMTESAPVTLCTPYKYDLSKVGTCGQLYPNTQGKIVSLTDGSNLGPHQSGELYIRGPQVMKGYLNNEKATKETVDSDGWLHTGDVAYYDQDGFFFIVDRTKELIKVKGNQVSPTELENLILELPEISDVAVAGIADETAGELPRAYVVLKHGQSLKEETVINYVQERVVKYKHLAGGVRFVKEIPRNAAGKVLRQQLHLLGAQLDD